MVSRSEAFIFLQQKSTFPSFLAKKLYYFATKVDFSLLFGQKTVLFCNKSRLFPPLTEKEGLYLFSLRCIYFRCGLFSLRCIFFRCGFIVVFLLFSYSFWLRFYRGSKWQLFFWLRFYRGSEYTGSPQTQLPEFETKNSHIKMPKTRRPAFCISECMRTYEVVHIQANYALK